MAVVNGTIDGVTMLSGNPAGIAARKSYLITCNFGAFNSATPDTATVTGVLTAINAACRDGKTRTLRGGICVAAGQDTSALAFYMTGATVQALAVANSTTTGDFTGSNQLSDKTGTIQTSAASAVDCSIVAVVDEA
jgi:hypothetical protein